MRWRRGLLPVLALAAACQDAPTLAGGDPVPDGGRIFFVRTPIDPIATSGGSLHMTIDDEFRAVPIAPRGAVPIVSRDGRHVAWLETTYPDGFFTPALTRLFTYDRVTADTTELLTDSERPASASWSRSPKRLAFTRADRFAGGLPELVSTAPDGSDLRVELPAEVLNGAVPVISPDGERVVLPSRPVPHRLELIELATGARRFVTPEFDSLAPANVSHPAWSHDGERIALVRLTDTYTLQVIDLQGVVHAEQEAGGDAVSLSWAPDGRRLAFCRYVPDPTQGRYFSRQEVVIWTIATGELRVITPPRTSDCFPNWTR